tara:strand:- start:864 stop:2390 length:1527 start_codon:yes stop_codon:yes gene_type:complete
MKTKKTQLGLFLLGSILYNWFFWEEDLGLNLLLFNHFIIAVAYLLNPASRKQNSVLLMGIASLTTATMVFFYGSTISKLTNFVSLIVFIGYVHQPQLKAIIFALFTSLNNFFRFPIKQVLNGFGENEKTSKDVVSSLKKIKLVIIPSFFIFIFYWIFKASNPKFDVITTEFWLKFSTFFEWLFSDISWLRIPFFLMGAIITAAFIYHENVSLYMKKEIGLRDILSRTRKKRIKQIDNGTQFIQKRISPLTVGLKNEYRSALILIIAVNLLLMFVNGLDISWLWFNFEYNGDFSLSQFVHEGTYLLIFSILLSISIILYFFRKNINFFPENSLLKYCSIVWILQNVILVISVGLRNYYYIEHYGLAYKRIGVFVFLLLTVVGLITLILKITKLKSSFYLIKINTISLFTAFVLLSTINWDMVIAKHNLSSLSNRKVDVTFLLTLSDNTLPLIYENKDILNTKGVRYNGQDHHYVFTEKIKKFKEKQAKLSWLSMNLSSKKTLEYFNTNH